MTYSIVDIIRDGKPGEVYTTVREPIVEITRNDSEYLIFKDGRHYVHTEFIQDAILYNWQFEKVESVEEKVKEILLQSFALREDKIIEWAEGLVQKLKPYLKEEA